MAVVTADPQHPSLHKRPYPEWVTEMCTSGNKAHLHALGTEGLETQDGVHANVGMLRPLELSEVVDGPDAALHPCQRLLADLHTTEQLQA